jgi:hypothetical protein
MRVRCETLGALHGFFKGLARNLGCAAVRADRERIRCVLMDDDIVRLRVLRIGHWLFESTPFL